MKYFLIEGTFNNELMAKFITFANDYVNYEWTVFIDSNGGADDVCHTLIHIVNNREMPVTLIGWCLYSCAFELFYKSKCKKVLTLGCNGMYHLGFARTPIDFTGKGADGEAKNSLKTNKESLLPETLRWVSHFLTTSELLKFKKGEDVYFTFKRMQEIFPDAQIV